MLFREWLSEQEEEIEFDLVHAEEEHEIATICINPEYVMSIADFVKYEELLDAVVQDILYDSGYPTLIVKNVRASLVEEFQFYIAGY